MVDIENSLKNYKFLTVSIGAIIQNPVMLKFIPDHLKTKKKCKNAGNKLPLIIIYVPG